MVVLASAGGNSVGVIADLVRTSEDRVREMIHRFNEMGMASLDPRWAGGRPRLITTTDRELIVKSAKKRPRSLGQPFTRWSIRKLRDYLATKKGRKVGVSRERLRQVLVEEKITFQKTKTWKESNDPLKDQKLATIDRLLEHRRDRTFAFDEFGPLAIKPDGGSCWAEEGKPQRLRANYHKPHGTRQFFGCYSLGQDELFGVVEARKGWESTLRALQSIRAFLDDGKPIYVILDNLNHHKKREVREWCDANKVVLVFTPTYSSWANPIEAHFGPLREFVLNNSDYENHAALARAIRSYLKWRNSHKRDPKILAAERRERLRVRCEAKRRWGYRRADAA
jgi:transposase